MKRKLYNMDIFEKKYSIKGGRICVFNYIIIAYCIVVAINLIHKNRESIRQLTAKQLILASFVYLSTVFLWFICIYYGGNWIAGQFSSRFMQLVVFILLIIITISLCQWPLRKILNRVTSGIFPKD
ncbi:hypothetical protein ACFTQ7_21620 [Lysinibacillus sp. NPDC056959]|uniref:hypothetical protein n=1 Tax=Lysinibacillus sp. NPDC056959 TaxID=3345981 RepID=UPI003642F118